MTLTCRFGGGRTSLLTVLARGLSRVRTIDHEGTRLVRVAGDEGMDWIAAHGITTGGAISTDARLAVCRFGGGGDGDVEQARVQGSFLRVDLPALEKLAALAGQAGASR